MGKESFKFSVTIAEKISSKAPVLLKGDLTESVKIAKELNYNAVEIHLNNPKDINSDILNQCCQDYNMQVSALGTGMGYIKDRLSLIDDSLTIRKSAIERLKEHIDLSSKLKSAVIIGSMRGNINKRVYSKYEDRFIEIMKVLGDYAYRKDVTLLIEAINRYENDYLNTSREVIEIIGKISNPNIKVHLDTFHMNIEESKMYKSIEVCGSNLGYIHFADSNRHFPGAGHVDFNEVLNALQKINYKGYVSFEHLPEPEALEASRRGLMYIKSLI